MGATSHIKLFTVALCVTVLCSPRAAAKPSQLQEERREFQYQRSHKITSSTVDGGNTGYYGGRSANYQTAQDSGMSQWAQHHQEQVQRMAERMRSEYNAATSMSSSGGGSARSYSSSVAMAGANADDCDKPTAYSFSFSGKSQAELDEMAKSMTHQIIEELHNGQLRQSQVMQPQWFLHRAAEKMEEGQSGNQQYYGGSEVEDLKQQQQQIFTDEELRQTQGTGYRGSGGYSQQNYNRENYERDQKLAVVSGGHFSSTQSKTEEEERHRTYRPQPTPYSTAHSQSASSQTSEQRSQTVYPPPVAVLSVEHNKQDSEYYRQSQPTAIPSHDSSYFSQSQYNRHRQYNQRPRPLESGSSTVYQSNVEEQESQQRQIPVDIPTQHTYTASSQVNKETESIPAPLTHNYAREHSEREESGYSRNRTYVAPLPSVSSVQRQRTQSEYVTITPKPVINTGSVHRIYDYNKETDLKVSPLYKPAYTEQSHHEKFEEEQMRLRQQTHQLPVVTISSQKEQSESEVNRQRYRPQTSVDYNSVSESEDTHQVQQSVYEQPSIDVESLHRETEEEERRRVYTQRQPGYVHTTSYTDETEESERLRQQRLSQQTVNIETAEEKYNREYRQRYPQTSGSTSSHVIEETDRSNTHYRPGYTAGYSSQSGYNKSEESVSRDQHTVAVKPSAIGHFAETQENVEESEYHQQYPGQTIHTTTVEERNEEMRRRQQQQADYERRYSSSGYNRTEAESSYSGGRYQQPTVSGGRTEYSLEELERQRTAGGSGYYVQTGTYSKEEEERRRLEYESRQRQQYGGASTYGRTESEGGSNIMSVSRPKQPSNEVEIVESSKVTGPTANQDKTSYTSSFDEDDNQQKQIEVDAVVENFDETSGSDKLAKTIVSKDRGDQPPQTYESDYESEEVLEAEPGIGYYPTDKKPEVGLLVVNPTRRPRPPVTTTANPYYSAPLAPYSQEKRRYESSVTHQTQVVPAQTAEETEEYRRHYQRTHSTQQHYTSGNLSPQQHAEQHELGNMFSEQTSDLYVKPSPTLETASQTMHQGASSDSSYSSSSRNNNMQRERVTTGTQKQYSNDNREHYEQYDDDTQQQMVAIEFPDNVGGSQRQENNEKYVASADQLEEARRRSDSTAKNSTWNQESSYTFNVQKEGDYDDLQQQVQDLGKEFEDIGQQRETENLTQQREDHQTSSGQQRSHQSSYSHGAHSSYTNLEAQERVPEVNDEEKLEEQKESPPGFWKRFRNKAKEIVG